jgi:hypothetical protein
MLWKPPSEWPTRSTFAAPVLARTRSTNASICADDWTIEIVPPTGMAGVAWP